jgi:phospholipid transport system substrate-binding protein
MKRRILLALGLALVLSAPAAAWADDAGPAAPIAAFDQALLKVMQSGKTTPFDARTQMLLPVIQRVFDLELILRNSVGLPWASFTAAAQAQLLDVFTRFTVASWVANFDNFDGQTFTISPDLRALGADRVVQSRMVPPSGDPIRLDYVMRRIGADWKVVDILLDGSISRVAVQRSDFRAVLSGGAPDKLIALLRDKTAALSAGGKS